MLLGAIFQNLQSEPNASMALQTLGDADLASAIGEMGARFDETPAEYAMNAARRYAAAASNDDWLAMMTALERSDDPARICLDRMLRWALRRDAAELARPTSAAQHNANHGACGCGGGHGCR